MLVAWLALAGYAVAAVGLGWAAHRRRDAGAAYWTASRQLSAASVGLSISAGFMSISWSCVFAVQLFYWYGLGAAWLITIPWLAALAGIYALSGRYRSLPAFSQPEMVGERFGHGAKRIVALALVFVFLVWGGAEIYVAANLLAPGLGVSTPTMVLVIAVIVGLYATLGGFRGVVSTDKLQYSLVALYIGVMAWLAFVGLRASGLGSLATALEGARSSAPWTDLFAPGLGIIALTFVAYLPGWLFETDLWLRVQAARDRAAARRGVLLAGINALLFVGLLPLFIGVAALSIFPMEAAGFPAEIGNEGDAIFAALVQRFAPAWLEALVGIGLAAAAMSTIDTCANVMALSIAYDIWGVHESPGSARRSQVVTAASIAAAAVFALRTESLWDMFYLSSGILTTTVAFPVAAVLLPWVTRRMVVASATSGFAATFIFYFLESRGMLDGIQPAWLTDSGLGYILWGGAAAALGAIAGRLSRGTDAVDTQHPSA